MRERSLRRLAWAPWVAALASLLALIPVSIADRRVDGASPLAILGGAIGFVWVTVGALIAARQHGNAVGWLLCGVGSSFTVGLLAQVYAVYGLRVHPGVPGSAVAALVGEYAFFSVAQLPLLFLLFPDGRVPARRWRPVAWAIIGGTGLALLGSLVKPEALNNYRSYGITYRNPLGVEALAGLAPIVVAIGTISALLGSFAAAVALRYRYRRSSGDVRRQIRWLAYVAVMALAAALLAALVVLASPLVTLPGRPFDALLGLAAFLVAFGVPAAVGLAIFRHRLYDIDVVINKTLVYGALTGVLGAVYASLVLGLGLIGRSLGGSSNSPWVVAASTLAAAALFRPLRGRVREIVDRRFYRHRYDAQLVLEAFTSRLRDEVDLETVRGDLVKAVLDTVQPDRAALWLRVDVQR